jgi:hypothetical protein
MEKDFGKVKPEFIHIPSEGSRLEFLKNLMVVNSDLMVLDAQRTNRDNILAPPVLVHSQSVPINHHDETFNELLDPPPVDGPETVNKYLAM